MKFKGTIALFAVFLALGGYMYFAEYKGKDSKAADEKKKAIAVEAKDITEISLVFPDHTITGVRKAEKVWEITSPAGTEPDQDEWELLSTNVPRIEREDTVTSDAADLAQFGLKDPDLKVVAKTKDGKTIELLFGAENPRKIYNYAKFADSKEVFLSPSSWSRIFKKTLTDLRNKKVLELEPDDVDSVTLLDGTRETLIQKSGPDWQLKKPADTKADAGEMSTFLSSIRFARAGNFADATVDARAAGLEPPALRITLHDAKANANRELLIGKSPETDKFYARDGSRPAIMILDKDIAEKSRRPLFAWRDKGIAQLDRDQTDQIEIIRGKDTLVMKKDGADWKTADGKKLQADRISDMINTLEFEKAKDIIDVPGPARQYGLDKARMEVVFRQGGKETLRLVFGSDSKVPEGVYVKAAGPAVKVVSRDVYDKFNVKAEELVESAAK